MFATSTQPRGDVQLQVIPGGKTPESLMRPEPAKLLSAKDIFRYGWPQSDQHPALQQWKADNVRKLMRRSYKLAVARALKIPHFYGALWLSKIDGRGDMVDYGLVSLRVVTTAGVNYIVDAFQNSVEVEDMKYHGIGTGTTGAVVGDTSLETELTTEYNPDNTRATGTTAEGASANIYQTVATNTLDSGTPAVTEHGILSASSSGTLLDRHTFSAINLDGTQGDGLQSTYELTFSAGG